MDLMTLTPPVQKDSAHQGPQLQLTARDTYQRVASVSDREVKQGIQ